ncbi:phage minor head protein [Micromonospora sp. KC721]|uniref:phage minor head protein n=1 Tax=Micromonospora sp. KC721 TaxID=2530380 RepID=UPI00104D73F8|nr:phage minor head protein [Micromonospora sp. KC721]TDB79625.1 hypothetical protein E1182_12090 [Micromonospora sp. KC721]
MADEPDPWLPLRLTHEARVIAAEKRIEQAAHAALRTWLRSARQVTLPVTAAALPADPSALAGAGQAWFEAMTVHLLPAVDATFLQGVADAGGDVELLRVAQMKDEYLAALPNRLQGVPDSAWTQVTAAVAELTADGASIPRIRDAIEEILGDLAWQDRAVTIARTETIGAYNAGTLTAWLTAESAADERLDKVWVATHDERTRDDHRNADGQRVALDGAFVVGGVPLRYPGDPAAPPGQTVQCRCTMIEVPADEPLPSVPEHPWPRRDRAAGLDITVTAAGAAKGGKPMATWKGTLAPLGARSGDRRIFAADGEWSFRDLPLPLRWAREDAPGHEGAVTIGRITAGEVQKSKLTGSGDFLDAVPELGEALELLRAGVLFPSVDLDDFEFVYTDEKGKPVEEMSDEEWEAFIESGEEPYITVVKGRVMAVTLVGTQAFMEARLELVDDEQPADGTEDETPSDEVPKEEAAVVAAGADSRKKQVAPLYPPRAWFDDPGLTELTPITVTADGRVFGHLADNDCHLSFLTGGQCVLPPAEGGFDWFHRPEIQTAEGDLVAVGHITAGTGHADLALNAAAAVSHYDDTGTQIAVVRAGRDGHGIWVAGSLVPEATEEQAQLLRRSPLSGDWRWIGGARQLVAALCVNVGGFPVVRGRSSGGRAYAMVASGWPGWRPSERAVRRPAAAASPQDVEAAVRRAVEAGFAAERQRIATAAQAERIAASIGRDRKTLVAALTATVHGE